jgi:uncharacterized membrane protein
MHPHRVAFAYPCAPLGNSPGSHSLIRSFFCLTLAGETIPLAVQTRTVPFGLVPGRQYLAIVTIILSIILVLTAVIFATVEGRRRRQTQAAKLERVDELKAYAREVSRRNAELELPLTEHTKQLGAAICEGAKTWASSWITC